MTEVLRKLSRGYAAVAIMVLSIILLFVLVNAAFLVFGRGQEELSGIDNGYLPKELPTPIRDEVYPGMSPDEVKRMVRESWAISYEYEPYREFQPKATRGKYTSNSAEGFRFCKNQGPWPPSQDNYNVFLFGGSTTYNVGVPEDDTIASHLQDALMEQAGRPVRVYNFGCPLFFSSPEGVLFERLLVNGHKPDLAVFIDGLNEYFHERDEPGFSEKIAVMFANRNAVSYHLRVLAHRLPVVRAFREHYSPASKDDLGKSAQEWERQDVLESIQRRYWSNVKNIQAVADVHGVKTLFVWQPTPQYKYRGTYPSQEADYGRHTRSQYGYKMMADYVVLHAVPPTFLWLADMQEDLSGTLYVDLVHYSGRMSKELALRIGACLRDRKLLE